MIRVPSPREGVLLGLAIVDEIRARSRFPIVRVDMHTGTAVERGGDWYGATVNLAARISAVAGGNEVLLSEATRKAAELSSGVELQRRGPQSFKNVGEPVVIYRALRYGDWRGPVAIDPVCRMAVDPAHAAGKLAHDGAEYSFCSLECAAAFAADPQRYVPKRD
ncbi:MAG TPA: YHS domain-containing protein [Solirubrobacterales bacterium]|jgi:YHS domain-containing protein|nr:YHS domain-containing protein [Solirubrobacterales bacterium]